METLQGEEPTVVINSFEDVEVGKEEEFLARWRECSAQLKQQEGYMSHRFHQSSDAGARFRFVNTSLWRSPRHFQAAMSSPAFLELAQRVPGKYNAQLYRVIDKDERM